MKEEKILIGKKELEKMLLSEFKKGYLAAKRAGARKKDGDDLNSICKGDFENGGEKLKFRGT